MKQQVLHRFYVLGEDTHSDVSFGNDDNGTQLIRRRSTADQITASWNLRFGP
jgi:hypothetical protein